MDSARHLYLNGVKPNGNNIGVGAYRRVFEVEFCGTLYAAKEIYSVLIGGVEQEGFFLKEKTAQYKKYCLSAVP